MSDVLVRNDSALARTLYVGRVGGNTQDIRNHHLEVVGNLCDAVDSAGTATADRVAALRAIYETASGHLETFARTYSRAFAVEQATQVGRPYDGLQEYAEAEGLWP
jgi:hypothetical protein